MWNIIPCLSELFDWDTTNRKIKTALIKEKNLLSN